MSRCSICDYSQSADSLYHNSLSFSHSLSNNRIVYSPDLKKDVCISCLEEHLAQQNFWSSIAENDDVCEVEAEDPTEYCGCTEVKTD